MNLFSSFDPVVSLVFFNLSLNWISALLSVLLIPQKFWLKDSQFIFLTNKIINAVKIELMAVFGSSVSPGVASLFLSYFMFIIICNFSGLFPYVFTPTSHLSMTLALSLPLWLGSMFFSFLNQFDHMMAHLVPSGTPPALMPVMVIIESVSSVIRPLTLAIRLAANMVAGHLLLTLLGNQGPQASGGVFLGLMIGLILLLVLECAVACIQAYVFTVLNSLYLNELMSTAFNKTQLS